MRNIFASTVNLSMPFRSLLSGYRSDMKNNQMLSGNGRLKIRGLLCLVLKNEQI